MTYHNAMKYIRSAPEPGVGKPNYNGIRLLCERLGNPQKRLRYLRLAGSNGKTVCGRMLVSVLQAASLPTGCLTMPMLDDIKENILINGKPLSMEETVRYMEQISRAVTEINREAEEEQSRGDTDSESKLSALSLPFRPTSSEILLTMALLAFREKECALCLIESDHSGADPSKFLTAPFAAVICGTIPSGNAAEIAKIRSYICRGIQEIVSAPQNSEAFRVISDTCSAVNCRLTLPKKNELTVRRLTLRGTDFSYKGVDYSLRLCGKFQVMNAAVTLEAVDMLRRRGYNVTEEAVIKGFSSLNLRSRFEVLSVLPLIIADSTHKEVAIHTVCDSMADFKEMTGSRVRLCLPVGELVEQYISALEKRGYEIESVICMGDREIPTDSQIPTVLCQTPKATAKAALTDLDREQILLISGNCCFTDRIRYEILSTLSY